MLSNWVRHGLWRARILLPVFVDQPIHQLFSQRVINVSLWAGIFLWRSLEARNVLGSGDRLRARLYDAGLRLLELSLAEYRWVDIDELNEWQFIQVVALLILLSRVEEKLSRDLLPLLFLLIRTLSMYGHMRQVALVKAGGELDWIFMVLQEWRPARIYGTSTICLLLSSLRELRLCTRVILAFTLLRNLLGWPSIGHCSLLVSLILLLFLNLCRVLMKLLLTTLDSLRLSHGMHVRS